MTYDQHLASMWRFCIFSPFTSAYISKMRFIIVVNCLAYVLWRYCCRNTITCHLIMLHFWLVAGPVCQPVVNRPKFPERLQIKTSQSSVL